MTDDALSDGWSQYKVIAVWLVKLLSAYTTVASGYHNLSIMLIFAVVWIIENIDLWLRFLDIEQFSLFERYITIQNYITLLTFSDPLKQNYAVKILNLKFY